MPDVPPIPAERNQLVHTTVQAPTRSEQPPPCPRCGMASWWNGWRLVFPLIRSPVAGVLQRLERWLARAKCSGCRLGFTVYPPGHYPHRQYQLDVVADVAATASLGQVSAMDTAKTHDPSPTSVRRWTAWVADLVDPIEIWALTARLDPHTPLLPPPAAPPEALSVRARASRSLMSLEALGQALVRSGVSLVSRSGLGRLLEWQYTAHRQVCRLTSRLRGSSPAMALVLPGEASVGSQTWPTQPIKTTQSSQLP